MTTATNTKNSVINGVNVGDVTCLINEIDSGERAGVAGFRARTVWKGGLSSTSYIDGWTLDGEEQPHNFAFDIDEPCGLAGADDSPNPQEFLLSALNSCVLNTFVAYCSVMGIELEKVEVRSKGDLDLHGFLNLGQNVNPGYDDVQYTIAVKGKGTPEQFKEVHDLVKRTSPNFANFARAITLNPRLVVE